MMKFSNSSIQEHGPYYSYEDRIDYTYLEFKDENGEIHHVKNVSVPHEIDAGLKLNLVGDYLIQEVGAEWRDDEDRIENALVFTCINGVRRDGSTWLRKAQAEIIPSGWEMFLNPFGLGLFLTPFALIFGGWLALPFLWWSWNKRSEKMARVNREVLAAVEQM